MTKARRKAPTTSKDRAQGRTVANAAAPTAEPLANRHIGGPARRVQRKITVAEAGSHHEREADAVADAVVGSRTPPAISSLPAGGSAAQRTTASTDNEVQTQRDEEPAAEVPEIVREEIVQTAADEEQVQPQTLRDEEVVQTQALDQEAPIQTQAFDEDGPVQASSGGGGSWGAATRALRRAGSGSPIPAPTLSRLESGMGMDLGHVRVHEGPTAADANRELRSRAFTHGSDIWLGGHESPSDLRLMSHEATHVVQQSHSLQGVMQRQGEGDAPSAVEAPATRATVRFDRRNRGTIDTEARTINIDRLEIPAFKAPKTAGPFTLPRADAERDTDQVRIWESNAAPRSGEQVERKVRGKDPVLADGTRVYYLRSRRGNLVMGSIENIKARVLRPTWNRDGQYKRYDVDHMHEHQLSGADLIENMWLLDAGANRSSGTRIRTEVRRTVNAMVNAAKPEVGTNAPGDVDVARRDYRITFDRATGGLDVGGDPRNRWTLDDITSGRPLQALTVLGEREIDRLGLRGSPERIALFKSPLGGSMIPVPLGPDRTATGLPIRWSTRRGANLELTQIVYPANPAGRRVTALAFRNSQWINQFSAEVPIAQMPGVEWGGYVSTFGLKRQINAQLKDAGLKKLSPIALESVDLDDEKGVIGRGKVLPTVPFIRDVAIDLVIDGQNIYLSKVFATDDFTIPGPIDLTESSLELRLGTQGFEVIGQVLFEIPQIGSGSITGSAGTESGFSLEGQFAFLSDLFDPAEVRIWYRKEGDDYTLGGSGTLTIPEGKVRGIKTATVTATIENESISAAGTFEADFPGVESGSLSFVYSPEEGYAIGGALDLSSDIPGIESGRLEATLARAAERERWKLSGAITATPSIPGITSTISGTYDDGAFTIEGSAEYERGMAAGQVRVGATNRATDDEGNPTGEPTDALTAYGGGTVSLTIAPWLEATVGLTLLPNGEIEVSGEIGLPDALEIFPQKELEKEIFSINIDIPVLGFAVAGQRVGIFATVGGGLSARASIGPAELQDLSLGITWNPDHQEDTKVTGGARLHLPANAGLRLFIRGGLGAGIPIVSAVLGIEIGGTLGIEAAIGAAVDINWTPATGLVVDALAEAYAQPKFTFDVAGFAEVEVDLPWPLGDITLYEERWNFASFEYGADLRLGMKLPVHFQEGQPFEPSIDDVEFEIPQVNPREVLAGLVDQLI